MEMSQDVAEGEFDATLEGDVQKHPDNDSKDEDEVSREGRGQRRTFELTTWKKVVAGLVIVVAIALSWVGSTQTAKSTYDKSFTSPYFMVYFTTSWMTLTFPLLAPFYFVSEWLETRACTPKATLLKFWRESRLVFSNRGVTPLSLLTSTVFFTLVWEVTNYAYLRGLTLISSTDVTAVFSSAPAFVYILSICILREPVLVLRVLSVVLAIGGVVLFAYSDGFTAANVEGVLLTLGAGLGAAVYKVCLKLRFGDATVYQMGLFLSTLGLFNVVAFWPIVLTLHLTGVESLTAVQIPWAFVLSSAILGFVFNFFINFGIALTFPIFISLGTVLGIPINAVVDLVVRCIPFAGWKFTASDLIIGGFLLMLIPVADSRWIHNLLKRVFCCFPRCRRFGRQ